ncbi:MAG: hypothetical protein HQ542_04885 [Bacteroidia bacterium]|nr:hypothetical protein [Bacteroidia bacterium]
MNNQIFLSTGFLFIFLFGNINLTLAQGWACGDSLIDSRDGRVYTTVQIVDQCWIAENMNIGSFIPSNGPGQLMHDDGIIEKYCFNGDTNYCNGTNGKQKYGAFYEWKEAMQFYAGQPGLPAQGICPDGWHIPSQGEFNTLITFLGGSNIAGGKMKIGGSSGFEGILTGFRCTLTGGYLSSPTGGAKITYYWTANQANSTYSYFYELCQSNSSFGNAAYSPFYKSIGNSIRCLRDQTTYIEETGTPVDFIDIRSISQNSSQISIVLHTSRSGRISLTLLDIRGKMLKQQDYQAVTGVNELAMILPEDIRTGIYLLRFSDGSRFLSRKIKLDPHERYHPR